MTPRDAHAVLAALLATLLAFVGVRLVLLPLVVGTFEWIFNVNGSRRR